jgi:hypothetical protein
MAKVRKWLSFRLVLTILTYSLFSFGRIIHSFSKMASDPSYDFVEEINRLGLRSFVSGSEGYLQIGPRLIAYIAHWFPVRNQAVVLSFLATFTFISCALIINRALTLQTSSAFIGYVSGAILLLVPAASESTVGNHGSVKWSIVVALCVVLICPAFIDKYPNTTIAIAIISTLCSPLSILASSYLCYHLIRHRKLSDRKFVAVFFSICSFTCIQFLYWLFSGKGTHIYGGDIRYSPWPGMGQFWWSLLLTPPIFVGGSILLVVLAKLLYQKINIEPVIFLAISTALITISSYITTGIKDSTAIAWQSLSWILVVLTLHEVTPKLKPKVFGYIAIALTSAFFIRSIEKWYSASWYLTDGLKWSYLVDEAKQRCESTNSNTEDVQLLLSTVEINCNDL